MLEAVLLAMRRRYDTVSGRAAQVEGGALRCVVQCVVLQMWHHVGFDFLVFEMVAPIPIRQRHPYYIY